MRRLLVVLGFLALLAVASTATGSALSYPNPCTIASAADLGKALGVASALTGARSSEAGGAAAKSLPLCTFTHGSAMLKITVGPKAEASGGSGGPAGMKTVTPSGLGQTASEAYDHSPQFNFTSITFVKGPYWLSVWGNGGVPTAKVLALAKTVYASVP